MSGKKRKEMVPVIVVILLIVLVGCDGALTADYQKNDSVG